MSDSVWWTPAETLWVERSTHAGEARTFDVFARRGRVIEQVRLPSGREVVGFGREAVYTVERDALELRTLERYRR